MQFQEVALILLVALIPLALWVTAIVDHAIGSSGRWDGFSIALLVVLIIVGPPAGLSYWVVQAFSRRTRRATPTSEA